VSAGRADILEKILAVKREEVAGMKAASTAAETPRSRTDPRRSLAAALRRGPDQPMRVLSVVKRASPSAGPIRPGADPAAIAREYAEAGAAAISVLTDKQFFDGDIAFLRPCRDAVAVPILRKDFLIDPVQVSEAASRGADAVLLIVAALSKQELGTLLGETAAWNLEALVEVHDLEELDIALSVPQPPTVIGVNHRDLRTFTIDMTLTEQVARRVPADVVLVAESGIRTADDVRRMRDAGAHAVLVGEHLMRAPSPGAALKALLA
jgi:indole-3-glycerol phosphate synthase